MSDSMTPEKSPVTEIPQSSAFKTMQIFLREKGELTAQTIPNTNVQIRHYQYDGKITFVESLFGRKDYHSMDLYLEEEIPPDTDPYTYRDFRILLKNDKLYEKNLRKKDMPGEALTEIVLVNPASGEKTKAMIDQFNPINEWLGLSKDKWQEDKDPIGSIWVTDSEEEAQKIVQLIRSEVIESKPAVRDRSKRLFIKRGIQAAGVGVILTTPFLAKVAGILNAEPVNKPLTTKDYLSDLNTQELKEFAEQRFQIELIPGRTVLSPGSDQFKGTAIEWEEEDLRKLIRALSKLPPHFYQPRKFKDTERILIGKCVLDWIRTEDTAIV